MKHKDTRFKKKTIISYFPPDQAVMCVLNSYNLNPLFKIVLKKKQKTAESPPYAQVLVEVTV